MKEVGEDVGFIVDGAERYENTLKVNKIAEVGEPI